MDTAGATAAAKPRIGVVGPAPWLAHGLAAALADDGRWTLLVMPTGVDPTVPADAYVLHAPDAADTAGWQVALPPHAPLLWVGGGVPAAYAEDSGEALHPLALLPADAGSAQLRAALAAVLAGLSVRSPGGWSTAPTAHGPAALAGSGAAAAAAADGEVTEALTSRELEVYELLAKGLSNRDIAGVLGISAHTAKFHVAQILAKVGAATRAEAVAIGLRLGLIGL